MPRFISSAPETPGAARGRALDALVATPASASPGYFYDRLGSNLFDAITELDEYYPTRTEASIFARHAPDMARRIGPGSTIVDLGAGNGAKAARLFPLLEPRRYVAVDISAEYLRDALLRMQLDHPALEIVGLGLDYTESLDLPPGVLDDGRPLFFYPGSSIGNFTPEQALGFLRRVHARAAGGGLLVGVDLVKAKAVLDAAYDDPLGVTAAFNRNLLRNLNRALGSDFDPAQWDHVAYFDTEMSRIEMHLEAREALVVRWPGGERTFRRGERIHTENSCKYTVEGFGALLAQAGFRTPEVWTDDQRWFAVFWAPA